GCRPAFRRAREMYSKTAAGPPLLPERQARRPRAPPAALPPCLALADLAGRWPDVELGVLRSFSCLRLRRFRPGRLQRLEHGAEAVDDVAEEVGGELGVVGRRVRGALVPPEARGLRRARQDRLAVGHAAQRRGVEAGERVERIAL